MNPDQLASRLREYERKLDAFDRAIKDSNARSRRP
jgi:hypothetical protein